MPTPTKQRLAIMVISRSAGSAGRDMSAGPGLRKGLILAVIVVEQLLIVLDVSIINIALPSAQQALHISDADRQWVITAYTVAFAGLLLLGGRIADFVGRKRAFIIGLIGFAAASGVGGLAQSELMLFGARALQGAFGALMAPAALSLLACISPSRGRERAFAVYGASTGAGSAIGLLLGGVLTQYASWRWTLLTSAPIAIIAAVAAGKYIPESPAEGSSRYDIPGALTSTLGLAASIYGFAKAAADGWGAGATISTFVVATVLLIVFVLIELRSRHPLLPMSVVRNGTRGGAYLTNLLVNISLYGVFLVLTLYLQQTLHLTALMTGVAFLPITVGVVCGAGASARFQNTLGPRILMFAGAVLATIGTALLTRIGVSTSYSTHVVPALVMISFGSGMVFGPMSSAALFGVAEHDVGVASATSGTAQQVGGSLGTGLLNTIATSAVARNPARGSAAAIVHGYSAAFWFGAGSIAMAAIVSVVLIKG